MSLFSMFLVLSVANLILLAASPKPLMRGEGDKIGV
jgi:hypothetical protein